MQQLTNKRFGKELSELDKSDFIKKPTDNNALQHEAEQIIPAAL